MRLHLVTLQKKFNMRMLPISKTDSIRVKLDWDDAFLSLLLVLHGRNPLRVGLLKTEADDGMMGMEGRLKII